MEKNYAYITMLDNEPYIYSVIALYSSWLKTQSKYDFYCGCTKNVSQHILNNLTELGIKIISLPEVSGLEKLKTKLKTSGYNSWIPALNKLAIYNLTQFDKLVFLDADTYIYENVDHLFNYPPITAVADGCGWCPKIDKFVKGDNYYKRFNAGVMVIQPSEELFNKIIKSTETLPQDRPWADQNIVNELYPNWMYESEKHLPFYYNCFGREIYNYVSLTPSFDAKKIKILHLVGRKLGPDYDFSNVFGRPDGKKHEIYYELLLDICQNVNVFIKEKQSQGLLKNLSLVKLPKASFVSKNTASVDLVIPYVDCLDKNWQEIYNQYKLPTEQKDVNQINRFRGQGEFLRFLFRSIDKNLPWIRNIYFLVQSESQVPTWLDTTKVKVILHNQFIPEQYLPTFNSCAIEMFLWNIPGLSEKFIYINDDFYMMNPCAEKDFFDGDKVKFNLIRNSMNESLYDAQCFNNNKLLYNIGYGAPFYRLGHIFRPYLKSKMIECYNQYKDEINNSITRFRDKKNYNCYIYSLYLFKNNLQEPSYLKYIYIGSENSHQLMNIKATNMVCVNDCALDSNIYASNKLQTIFYNQLPQQSKYELNDFSTTRKNKFSKSSIMDRKEISPSSIPFTGLAEPYWN